MHMQTQQNRDSLLHGFLVNNLCFLSFIGLQALCMLDALSTVAALSLPGVYETNPYYFAGTPAKMLTLLMLAYWFLNRKTGPKTAFLVSTITASMGLAIGLAVINNLMIITGVL